MHDVGSEAAGQEMPVGASAASPPAPLAPETQQAIEGAARGSFLALGEDRFESRLEIGLGDLELAEPARDAEWAPVLALGAGAGEIPGEGGVVEIAALVEVGEGGAYLLPAIAGPRHLERELAATVGAIAEPGQGVVEGARARPLPIS